MIRLTRFVLLSVLLFALCTGDADAGLITSVSVTGQIDIRVTQIAPTPLGEDALAYTDRLHEWNELPAGLPELMGAEYIMTGNDHRDEPELQITVTLSQPATLYLFFDTRIEGDGVNQDTPRPWMTELGLVDTGFDIGQDSHGNGTIETHNSIYAGLFQTGDVVFGAQARGGVGMYGIAAINPVPEPTSLTLLGIGAVSLFGYGLRRKRALAV